MQGSIQGADPRKSHPALGVFDEQAPEHPELVGDPGVHDGVIDVADDHIPATGRRDEDLCLRLNRLGLLQSQVHRVPQAIVWWRQGRGEMDPEIAVAVGGEGFFRPVEPGCSDRIGDGAAGNAPADIAQVSEEAIFCGLGERSRLAEHPADQEHLGAGSIAAVGLEDHTVRALRVMHRPSDEAQDPGECSQPVFSRARDAHGVRSVPATCLPMAQSMEKILGPARVREGTAGFAPPAPRQALGRRSRKSFCLLIRGSWVRVPARSPTISKGYRHLPFEPFSPR